jgi:23S rRNA (guanine745-N1)-methyltransferase
VLDDVLPYLACPYCGAGLTRTGSALHCARGHAFNVARQGYASLLPKKAHGEGGDTAAMVQARADFLAAGHFAGLAAEVAGTAAQAMAAAAADGAGAGCVVESGAGTGYYLARVLDELPGRVGVALDRSRYALRRAARAHERIGAVACDAWRRLPVAAAAAVLVLDVFAPRNGAELRRILNPAGRLVVVTPQDDHLRELAGALGLLSVDERKQERLAEKLGPYFDLTGQREYRA